MKGKERARGKIRMQEKRLFSNTFFLYLMTFSTQLFSFITVPYLARILGPSVYGKIGIAQAYMAYLQIILDFGFILSATQKVVECRNDSVQIGKIISAVFILKIMLCLVSSAVFGVIIQYNEILKTDASFYVLFMLATMINAAMPDFFYRGIEQMRMITVRTLIIKGGCAALTFLFIKSPKDLWLVPFFQLIGNFFAVIAMYFDLIHNHGIIPRKVGMGYIIAILKDSAPFFISRAASTVYQGLNTIILSTIYGTSPVVGYYTSADKIVSLSKSASSPIADSLYPYMLREKNYKLVRKMLSIFMPVILIGACIVFILADPFCIFLFGNEYASSGMILRCLLPIIVIILPTYILCFPVMVPLGLSRQANFSNVVGLITQIAGLALLTLSKRLNVYSLCILTSVSEIMVFIFRLFTVIHHVRMSKRAE